MADISRKLASKFVPVHRYANFGPFVNSVDVRGFRGVTCSLDFEYPVTAITGLNGAGKSTIGQLLLCAYKKEGLSEFKRFYVKDFFPVSVADPAPFVADASVEYRYQASGKNDVQALTVSRAVTEWGGYKRQPQKTAVYVGLTFYLPKVERRDLSIYSANNVQLTDRTDIEKGKAWASRILGNTYEDVFFQGVANATRTAELGMATRNGATYSENNMGFGEGRVIHSIRLLESCPIQSLVVLEEPETSLHEFAQFEFAKYLLDVSYRRGHQIVLSTHSSAIINAIPTEGRKLLARTNNGVKVYDRLSSIHIRNALTEGKNGHLIVCVEDVFAQSLLREVIRKKRKELLQRIKIIPFGDAIAVKAAVSNLRESGVSAVGVRDGDQSEIVAEMLYTLPGDDAPEKVIFLSGPAKQVLRDQYAFDLDHHILAYPETNHHEYAAVVSKATGTSREVIEADSIRAFMEEQLPEWADDLLGKIEAAA